MTMFLLAENWRVTLPLGRAGVVTERLKRTQSIWTLQKDRPKPKSQLYRLQARELPPLSWSSPIRVLFLLHLGVKQSQQVLPSSWNASPISVTQQVPMASPTPRSPPANSDMYPSATCVSRHDPPEPLSPRISLPLTPCSRSLSCNTQQTSDPHNPLAQAGVLTGAGGRSVLWATAEILPLTLRDAAWHYSGWSRTDALPSCKMAHHYSHTKWQLPAAVPFLTESVFSRQVPTSCPVRSTATTCLGGAPFSFPRCSFPRIPPCLPTPLILSHALVIVWKYKGHTFHHELFQILLTLTPRNPVAAAWSQGPGRTTQNVWAALSKS